MNNEQPSEAGIANRYYKQPSPTDTSSQFFSTNIKIDLCLDT